MSSPTIAMPEVPGVSHRFVETGGIRYHVAEAGEGPPVILLHGWPQHWYAWRHVIPLLAPDHRLICPDLRGFGWSDAPPGPYFKATFAADLVALLDELGLERVDLIAHDWGAWAGFIACLDHPERFSHYLALNIVTPWPEPPSAGGLLNLWRITYQVVLATPWLGPALLRRTDVVKRAIRSRAVHPEAWTEADLEAFAAPLREPARARASKHLYRTFLRHEAIPYLEGRNEGRRLRVPTLLLHGTRDPAIDSTRLGRTTCADDMRIELRRDSAHFIAEELPDIVADRARTLFAVTPAPASAGGRCTHP